jgi:hypothetical protein
MRRPSPAQAAIQSTSSFPTDVVALLAATAFDKRQIHCISAHSKFMTPVPRRYDMMSHVAEAAATRERIVRAAWTVYLRRGFRKALQS